MSGDDSGSGFDEGDDEDDDDEGGDAEEDDEEEALDWDELEKMAEKGEKSIISPFPATNESFRGQTQETEAT